MKEIIRVVQMGTIASDSEKEGQGIGTLAGVSPLGSKVTSDVNQMLGEGDPDIVPPQFFEWDEIKQPANCHECGKLHPFKDLIEIVEYFELNAEDAED